MTMGIPLGPIRQCDTGPVRPLTWTLTGRSLHGVRLGGSFVSSRASAGTFQMPDLVSVGLDRDVE